ncbi:MAG TPA: phenylacetate--CoA ligase [Xanthobacteraceae bacterium]|nr:phenylacetate--CoA ligase [Xanthobacteraceae bacterium]
MAGAVRNDDVFMFDRAAETMPRGELAALQLQRLQQTAARAYAKVPHVRAKFDAAGVKPEQIKSLADVTRLPFSVKNDLRDTYPFGLFAVPREDLLRLHASSGTTGKPTVVGYTKADLDLWSDLMARSLACMGARPGDIFHNAYGYGLFTGGLGFHYGAERLGLTTVPVSGGMTERQVTLIQDFGARILGATPSYALNIAEVAAGMGVDLRKLALRFGCFGAEPWSEAMRADLEAKFGIKAQDVYGLSEIIGPGVACECHEAQSGLHVWEDHFLVEVIDPDTLQAVPAGEPGELVLTTLTKEALPMLRYRTRDITRLVDEPCACGRTHRRVMRMTGRSDDLLIIRGVNVYPSQVEAFLVGFPGLAPHYQIVLTRDGPMDAMTLEVELATPAPLDELFVAKLAADVRSHIKSMVGVTCEVALKAPGEVPRSQGKAVRVKDLRQGKNG